MNNNTHTNTSVSKKILLKKFMTYYGPHKKLFIMDLLCALLVAIIDLIFPLISRWILGEVIPDKNIRTLFITAAVLFCIYLCRMFFNYFVNYYGHIVGVRMEYDMRKDLFEHLQKLSHKYYDGIRTGGLMSRMMNDLNEITELAHHGPEDIFLSVIMLIGAVSILFTIEWRLTLIVLLLAIIIAIYGITGRKKMSAAFKEVREKISGLNASLENSISGIRVAKAFTNEAFEIKKFNEGNEAFKFSKNDAYKRMAIFSSGIDGLSNLLNLSILIFGGYLIFKNNIDLADLVAFLLYIHLVMQPINRLSQFTQQFESGMTGFERFYEILNIEPDIKDEPDAIPLNVTLGQINFKDVTFCYNEGKDILSNIHLTVPAGKMVAIVGPSGGGKTTLCNLIPRFYDVAAGEVLIDGMNVKHVTLHSLRKNIGIVQQDVFLFAGTIRDNIIYGKVTATDDEIVTAARNANIHDFIMSLPNQYETNIGERGIKLSGGQKQRIAIARVFLKNPPILILDEATSSLDNETEMMIQKSLEELSSGRTTLVIAHRLSTIRHADEIIVIDENGLCERGTHQELLAHKGVYAKLYNSQHTTEFV